MFAVLIIDSLPSNIDKRELDRVYTLKCFGNDSLLMIELTASYSNEYDFIERIPLAELLYEPNDYELQNYISEDWALDIIHAQQAWDITHGSPDIKIGIVDQGFLITHEDIQPQIVYIGEPGTMTSHGTFVAGCAAGCTDNGVGKSSIGFNCKLMLDGNGIGDYNKLLQLSNNGAKVLNVSWSSSFISLTQQQMINVITDNGTLIVAGAGNNEYGNNTDLRYPASYDHVISVTATGPNDSHVSNLGEVYTHNEKVDVCAPGYGVLSTCADNNSCYSTSSGTSFSSPIVAGLAGLVFTVNPDFSPKMVSKIIKYSSEDIYDINPNYIGLLGTGRLDAYKAVSAAEIISGIPENIYVNSNYLIPNTPNEEIILDGIYFIDEEIHIYPGGKLTITGTVFLSENAKIVVERAHNVAPLRDAAELIVDGARLLSAGDYFWEGIEVHGFENESQLGNENGMVSVINNSFINDAQCAIKTTNEASNPQYAGGKIVCINSSFKNNVVACNFLPYVNFAPFIGNILPNVSVFQNCVFQTDDEMVDYVPESFLKLNSVDGISIKGCEFKNINFKQRFVNPGYPLINTEDGIGIYAYNSSLIVKELCMSPNVIPCQEIKKTNFSGLFYAIYALNGVELNTIEIKNCDLLTNKRSIYLSGFSSSTIIDNVIKVAYNGNPSSNPSDSYGIFLDECTGYTVENNILEYSATTYPLGALSCFGIIINNSGIGNNIIYNNSFNSFRCAIQPQNQNRGAKTGLKLKCNNFTNCLFDIAVLINEEHQYNGIASIQGIRNDPAGNLFTVNNDNEYNIYNEGDPITYWYHNNPYEYPVIPVNRSESVAISAGLNPYDPETSCPTNNYGGLPGEEETLFTEYAQTNNELNYLEQTYSSLVDNGNTQNLQSMVDATTSAIADQTKTELLEISPFVSDTVLKVTASMEDAFCNTILRDILIENPHGAKSEELLFQLLDREVPMSDYMMAEILGGRFTLSEKELFENNIADLDNKKQGLKNLLLNNCLFENRDSIKLFLENETNLNAKYQLAFMCYEDGDIDLANTILNNIPSDFSLTSNEIEEHYAYQELLSILSQNGSFSCCPDSLMIVALNDFLSHSSGKPRSFARNLLIMNRVIDYDEPILRPNPFKSSGFPYYRFNHIIPDIGFSLFPNPASKYVTINFMKEEISNVSFLSICNLTGIELVRKFLQEGVESEVINISNLKTGIYFCKFISDGKIKKVEKLTIID